MSLLPRALQFRDESLSMPLPEKERAYDWSPCPAKAELRKFERALGMVAVPGKPGHMTQVTEADCRQHKSNGTAQQPVPQVLPPSSPEAQGAVAVPPTETPPKFKAGQTWKRRRGDVVTVTHIDYSSVPVCARNAAGGDHWYMPDGRSILRDPLLDLVELVSPSKPTADSDGWIPKTGISQQGVPPDAYVEFKYADGQASLWALLSGDASGCWEDAVAYRVLK